MKDRQEVKVAADGKVYVARELIFRVVADENGLDHGQMVVDWYYSGDDEIVFSTNCADHETEHYGLLEFVFHMGRNIKEIEQAKCNQFGVTGDSFFFYRDIGATDCF